MTPDAEQWFRRKEMEAFDQLPPELRDAINYAPLSFGDFTVQVHQALHQGATAERAVWLLRNACFEHCPRWRPERIDPRGMTMERRSRRAH